jgi:SAM-dependent methyltransferase
VDIRVGTAEHLPWADEAFDAVISVNSLYYWSDLPKALGEIKRVLRPGGILVLGLRTKEEMDRVGIDKYGYSSPSAREVSDALMAAGFRSLSFEDLGGSWTGGQVVMSAMAA